MQQTASKDRRTYKRYAPFIFMMLEMTSVMEVLFIGYLIFGTNDIYKIIAGMLFISLFLVSYTKMNHVYHRSLSYFRKQHHQVAH